MQLEILYYIRLSTCWSLLVQQTYDEEKKRRDGEIQKKCYITNKSNGLQMKYLSKNLLIKLSWSIRKNWVRIGIIHHNIMSYNLFTSNWWYTEGHGMT